MKHFLLIIVCALIAIPGRAQQTATTADGKTVILHDDGTWEYDASDQKESTDTAGETLDCTSGDCSCWITEEVDQMTGKTAVGSAETLIISDDGKTGFGINMFKGSNSVIVSITAIGAGSCIDEGDGINVLFRDGERLELSHMSSFNCDANATMYFGGIFGKRKQRSTLANKYIQAMRVWTSDGYVQRDFTEEASVQFRETFACLANRK